MGGGCEGRRVRGGVRGRVWVGGCGEEGGGRVWGEGVGRRVWGGGCGEEGVRMVIKVWEGRGYGVERGES